MSEAHGSGPGRGILAPILFRLTLQEEVKDSEAMGKLPDREDMAAMLADVQRNKEVAVPLYARLRDTLGDRVLGRLERKARAILDETRELIESGRLPIGLPWATLLPLVVALPAKTADDDEASMQATLSAVFEQALNGLHEEDAMLFARCVDRWLASTPEADPSLVLAVRRLRELPAQPTFEMFDFELLRHGLRRGPEAILVGEHELFGRFEDLSDPALFSELGDLLEQQGYPALAVRTRALKPLPARRRP